MRARIRSKYAGGIHVRAFLVAHAEGIQVPLVPAIGGAADG